MAEKTQLTMESYKLIVGKAQHGDGRTAIEKDTGLGARIVGKVLAAAGATKSGAAVVERDRTAVSAWLERAGETQTTPWTGHRATRSSGAKKSTAKRSTTSKRATAKRAAAKS